MSDIKPTLQFKLRIPAEMRDWLQDQALETHVDEDDVQKMDVIDSLGRATSGTYTMSNIIPFNFESHQVRVQVNAGQPWFNAPDVCGALAFGNPRQALETHVDSEDVQKLDTLTAGGVQQVSHINESGLYALILGSTKPEAKRFKKWVTSEVLPSIRKTGSYSVASPVKVVTEAARAFPPLFRAARLIGCDKNAAAIAANQAVMSATQVNLLQQFGHTHLEAENQESHYFTPSEIGMQIGGLSGKNINLLLAAAGLQARAADHWQPLKAGEKHSRLFDTGKRRGNGVPVTQLKWAASVIPLLNREKAA